MKKYRYVYILLCKDGSYYTGRSNQPSERWDQHLTGLGSKYTADHPPEKLAYLEQYDTFDEAKRRELQIKGWSRVKKEKLISGEWGKW